MIGQSVGSYEVLEKLGAGGMGEVYRALDSKLGRAVALKILPTEVATDVERLARFEREAKTLAALNHPRIAQVYGFEDSAGVRALVMEFVPGESLSARVARGPVPVREALELARQIADGLGAAHEKGIVHRDLKPANVQVTPDGVAKLLDFGLAKLEQSADPNPGESTAMNTGPATLTGHGRVLGTVAYMSPEQARGQAVDSRTDVWAFGALLFELLTGCRAFPGPAVTDTFVQILEREPDWTRLPATTPTTVRALVKRCLRKNPQQRLHDIVDARLELDEALAEEDPDTIATASPVGQESKRPWWHGRTPWILTTALMSVVAAVAMWTGVRSPAPSPRGVRWLQVPAPFLTLSHESTIDISRDGTRLVYVGERDGVRRLYLRPLDSRVSNPIPGTESALCPFFSPDGQSVGFWADQKLKTVSLSGGWRPLAAAPLYLWAAPLKASWGLDGQILFGGIGARGIVQRLGDGGGTPEPIVSADPATEWYLFQPEMLPDRDHVLMTAFLPGQRVVAQSVTTTRRRTLVEDAYGGHYTPTRHLVYMQADKIIAAPFDLERLAIAGPPVVMVENVSTWGMPASAGYSLSDDGTLAFLSETTRPSLSTFVWVDREGNEQPAAAERSNFNGAQLSPDGRKVATWTGDDTQVSVLDLERGSLTRVTTEGKNHWCIWSPDGRRLILNSQRGASPGTSLFWQVADGSAPPEQLTTTDLLQQPRSFTPDGSVLVYQELHPDTGYDIWALPMSGSAKPTPLLRTKFHEYQPRLSPDGKWLAYVSNESGSDEVWVRAYPSMDRRTQISIDGGGEPAWSRDSAELFYLASDNPPVRCRLMAAKVRTTPDFRADAPRKLFEGPYAMMPLFGQSYDVSPDGKRFVMIRHDSPKPPAEIHIVVNWFEELRARVPSNQPGW